MINVLSNLAYNNVIENLPALYTYNVGKGAEKMPKQNKTEIDESKIKIIHTMADGTVRESIEGYVIPYNDTTAITYELLVKWTLQKHNKMNK